jgi:hydroxypyruvate reductase
MSQPEVLLVGPVLPVLLDALAQTYLVHKLWLMDEPDVFLQEQGHKIRAVVTTFVSGASGKLLAALPNLEIIASYGVGFDQVDLDTVRQRKLILTNTPDINEPVADTALALLLAVTRRICEADRFMRAGRWPQAAFPFGVQLTGKTCGIVGLGRIGRSIAIRAKAFGMRIAYHGPHAKPDVDYQYFDDLEKLAAASDVLMLALPGGENTQHIVDEGILSALGPQGFLINVARGSVVDEAAMIRKLQAGELAGAGLDVFEQEPLGSSPLMAMDNVVLLPHIASATHETRHAMGDVVMANLQAHFSGQPVLNPVL